MTALRFHLSVWLFQLAESIYPPACQVIGTVHFVQAHWTTWAKAVKV